MKKRVVIGVFIFLLGAIAGAVLMLLAYPFLFPPPVVNEQIINQSSKEKVLMGQFIHPNPSDPIHWGKGGVSIYRGNEYEEVFLETDFEVGPGPAYHVYLSSGKRIRNNDDFKAGRNTDLGKLKSFEGTQVYAIPAGIGPDDKASVVIWCEVFDQLISSASLMPGNPD